MGIQEYNGGAVLGMAGKNCVAVACDMRYGAQMQTMAIDKNKIFKMHDRCAGARRTAVRGRARETGAETSARVRAGGRAAGVARRFCARRNPQLMSPR